jgi:hypothetical protein
MKVYIVESDFGCYEDYTKVINGIYARPEIAEIEAQKIRDHYKEIREMGDPSEELENYENMPDDEYERLREMLNDYNEAIEYNQTVVKEYDVID